jgi:uroporphyrinogen-III synthase
LKGCIVACIGPVTAKTADDFGIKSHIIAEEYTIDGLTNAILEYLAYPQKGLSGKAIETERHL